MEPPESNLEPPTLRNAGYFLSLSLTSLALNHDCNPRRINRTAIHVKRLLEQEMDEKRYLQTRSHLTDGREEVFANDYSYPISHIRNFAKQMAEFLPIHRALPLQIEAWMNKINYQQANVLGILPVKPIARVMWELSECMMFMKFAHKIHPENYLTGDTVRQATLRAGVSKIRQELYTAQLLATALRVQDRNGRLKRMGLPESKSFTHILADNDVVVECGLKWWLEKMGYSKTRGKQKECLNSRGKILINWFKLSRQRIKEPSSHRKGIAIEIAKIVKEWYPNVLHPIRSLELHNQSEIEKPNDQEVAEQGRQGQDMTEEDHQDVAEEGPCGSCFAGDSLEAQGVAEAYHSDYRFSENYPEDQGVTEEDNQDMGEVE